ncbi:MAG: ParB/RepB/Spo0J family partition protein [Marivita sp.]|uniref:ParB/RepB/Spo0J family partition protein n=1 Tax=Marivita sp. TaxID=2003365 RepID=UPI003EF2B5E9
MTRRHDDIFNDVLNGLDTPAPEPEARAGARFLKRSNTIADRLSGEVEEKTLRWVEPSECRMWDQHNRAYDLLTEDNCRDLIDGIRAQGRQEFPAIVRKTGNSDQPFEVVCGARRHFAVSWLQANNYPQFKYLIEVRDLTDEEAFRLSDIENRDREDISDFERAMDYADAIERYYGGRQRAMADRLEVSEPWLSRFLQLAKLPKEVVNAFPTIRDIRERAVRDLKPLMTTHSTKQLLIAEAVSIAEVQDAARGGQGAFVDPNEVIRRLLEVGKAPKAKKPKVLAQVYGGKTVKDKIEVRQKGRTMVVEFDEGVSEAGLRRAFAQFMDAHFKHGQHS